jgi:hypothetical protein
MNCMVPSIIRISSALNLLITQSCEWSAHSINQCHGPEMEHVLCTHMTRITIQDTSHNNLPLCTTNQYHGDMWEPVICLADVGQSTVIQQDLLQNKSCHRLWELRATFHDTKTQWDDFCCQKECDHLLFISLQHTAFRMLIKFNMDSVKPPK